MRPVLIWAAVVAALVVPLLAAAASPLIAWRDPVYVAAGLAGVVALGLLLLQPLLAGGYLPGMRMRVGRRLHVWVGAGLVVAVVVHVGALWVTSPPDVADALLFRSPTPFSLWGVVAMWAVFATAVMATMRRKLRLRLTIWRLCHVSLAAVIVVGSVAHAVLIDGTMEVVSKTVLSAMLIAAGFKAVVDLRLLSRPRQRPSQTAGCGQVRRSGAGADPS